MLAHRFQHIPGRDRILIEVLARMFCAEAHVGIGREVHHQFRALHRFRKTLAIEQISLKETEPGMSNGTLQEPALAGR